MRKIFRNKKALSPVVASIILIAVTVAVSIAVAAWMGALTIGMMGGAEELKITDVTYTSNTTATIKLMNTGTDTITITDIRIDDKSCNPVNPSISDGYLLNKGDSKIFTITFPITVTSGFKYEFTVLTAQGNTFGPYTKTATW